ncbi:hypothetical protein ABVK25_009926 [Lepraria finkii]|uniref:Uncharacterized protein n=1 Tax=Lepraria finkii TaxID=1340010 RepID=A0ABR4AYQ0_9LECA
MTLTEVVPKPPTSQRPLVTPPGSPGQPAHKQILTLEHVQHVVELLKAIVALPAPEDATMTEEAPTDEQAVKIRASKLEYKTINEMWVYYKRC